MDVDVATSQSEVEAAEADKSGYWSGWLNGDKIPEHGTGEFETCKRIQFEQNEAKKCYLGCESPIAVRYSLHAETTATWSDIGMLLCSTMYVYTVSSLSQTVFLLYLV